ncbi:MAG: hypothetical protein IT340_18875 [Chloroflexi bacterium]|nr:hypothetical protein [Chloroflexota bacterium]
MIHPPDMPSHSQWLITVITVGLLLAGGLAPVAAADSYFVPAPIADPGGSLRTDGTYAVWATIEGLSPPGQITGMNVLDITAVDLRDGRLIPVATALRPDIAAFALADGTVVWIDQPADASRLARIRTMTLATGAVIDVTAPETDRLTLGAPAIGGGWVVWDEWVLPDGPHRLMGRDLQAMTPPIRLVSNFAGQSVQMTDRRVVWVEGNAADQRARPWQVRSLVIGDAAPTTVATITAVPWPTLAVGGDVAAIRAIGYTESDIVTTVEAIDLRTGTRTLLSRLSAVAQPMLATDGRFVVWNENTTPDLKVIAARMADLATTSRLVPTAPVRALGNGTALWYEVGPPRPGIVPGLYAAPVTRLLPQAPRPAPATTGPDLTYFPETGHSLAFSFQDFWERSGGLSIFGFPLTEEFEQRNADGGPFFTVQYLERQRFEYHPELVGTPYEVSLGRLGAEDAAQRADLRGLWALNPVPATAASIEGCRYVPETQHRLCGEFRPYWEGHGLELGDPGVSVRESLALFGYPISEEFIDPRTGLITQYFERAVFEYHAALPTSARVLLVRLGAQRLAAFGWE